MKKKNNRLGTKDKADKFRHSRILTYIYSAALCMVCMTTGTWAWYSKQVICENNIIRAATYGMNVTVSSGDGVSSGDAVWKFEAEKEYEITLEATGTAQKWYGIVSSGDAVMYTVPIQKKGVMKFFIKLTGEGSRIFEVYSSWGAKENPDITEADVVELPALQQLEK